MPLEAGNAGDSPEWVGEHEYLHIRDVIGRKAQQYPATQAEVLKVCPPRLQEDFDEERRPTVYRKMIGRCRKGRKRSQDGIQTIVEIFGSFSTCRRMMLPLEVRRGQSC